MKILTIEWKHFEKQGKTCSRCNTTGENLKRAIEELKEVLLKKDIRIKLKETSLAEEQMDQSNSLFFNGISLENLLNDISVLKNNCPSCGDLTGNPCQCRAVQTDKDFYEDIPKEMIKKAILKRVFNIKL